VPRRPTRRRLSRRVAWRATNDERRADRSACVAPGDTHVAWVEAVEVV